MQNGQYQVFFGEVLEESLSEVRFFFKALHIIEMHVQTSNLNIDLRVRKWWSGLLR